MVAVDRRDRDDFREAVAGMNRFAWADPARIAYAARAIPSTIAGSEKAGSAGYDDFPHLPMHGMIVVVHFVIGKTALPAFLLLA